MRGTKERWRRPSGRLVVLLSVLGIVVVAAVAVGIVLLVQDNGSSTPTAAGTSATSTPTAPGTDPVESLTRSHQLFRPECSPVRSARWVYPGTATFGSTLDESFAIAYPCKLAATWTKKFLLEVIPKTTTGNPIPIHGPVGYSCGAWPDRNGHAYAGGCQKGNHAFGWNWNVANPGVVFTTDSTGKIQLTKAGGADAETLLTSLSNNHYEIDVQNTSGIGVINSFKWSPPSGWKIEAITKTSGGSCNLRAGSISCSGTVMPPSCLCTGDGGKVVIDIAVAASSTSKANGKVNTYGSVGSKTQVTAYSPVPFLIPGTPKEARRQHGE